MSFFTKLVNKIQNIGKTDSSSATTLEESFLELEDLDKLEELLIEADLGPDLSLDFVEILRKDMRGIAGIAAKKINKKDLPLRLEQYLSASLKNIDATLKLNSNKLSIVMLVGVNGVGKTTSVAKLASRLHKEGKKILIAAADTFRAGAEEQLSTWAARIGVPVCGAQNIQDADAAKIRPSTVVYQAIEKAKNENIDLLIIDTAGRLQNKTDLMQELTKLKQVIDKNAEAGALTETLLVLDASTGQNAINQAELFNQACKLSGVILTKFDGTARGGVVFTLAQKFKLAVKFVGTGEGLDDLQEFDAQDYASKIINAA